MKISINQLKQLDKFRWEIPKSTIPNMKTNAIVYATYKMLQAISGDLSLTQTANVATLDGIVGPSLALPDIHQGYGFPIGGVAAFDLEKGIVSPGGVGFDINCGVRLLTTGLETEEVKPKLKEIIDKLFFAIPSGVGSKGQIRISMEELDEVLKKGVLWALEKGYAKEEDLEHIESKGCLKEADASKVSFHAKKRGMPQLGSLGSGNHFLEIQNVEQIFDKEIANRLGIKENQIVIMIHTGSRGLGHQVATDYISVMRAAMRKYNIRVPDIQLACAPINSKEGQDYIKAMSAAANYAWCNRQLITHWAREVFKEIFPEAQLKLVYDVAHNIAKFETHHFKGKEIKVLVHRKGATRAFPPGHPEIPSDYKEIGQPVLIPGDMGRASYILVGTSKAMEEVWGSTCHGSGRAMSRAAAKRQTTFEKASAWLKEHGIIVKCASETGITEEMPEAYKNVDEVVEVVAGAQIAKKIARMRPLGVVKG